MPIPKKSSLTLAMFLLGLPACSDETVDLCKEVACERAACALVSGERGARVIPQGMPGVGKPGDGTCDVSAVAMTQACPAGQMCQMGTCQ